MVPQIQNYNRNRGQRRVVAKLAGIDTHPIFLIFGAPVPTPIRRPGKNFARKTAAVVNEQRKTTLTCARRNESKVERLG